VVAILPSVSGMARNNCRRKRGIDNKSESDDDRVDRKPLELVILTAFTLKFCFLLFIGEMSKK